MFTQRNTQYLHIGGNPSGWSARSTSLTDLLTGEIGIFTPEGVQMTEANALTNNECIIATRQDDGVLVVSPPIKSIL